jgi:hypothetical protein
MAGPIYRPAMAVPGVEIFPQPLDIFAVMHMLEFSVCNSPTLSMCS